MKRAGHILILLLVVLNSAWADVYMKQSRHTAAIKIMGQSQPAEDHIQEIRITKDGFRSDSPEMSMIYQNAKKNMMVLDHENKTYREVDLGNPDFPDMGGPGDQEEGEGFNNMMKSMMKMDVTVRPLNEMKKIEKWHCKKYLMTIQMAMGKTTMEIWATEDLKIDPVLYSRMSAGMLVAMPGLQQAAGKVEKEMKKIKGVKVLTLQTTQIMGQEMKAETRLLEFNEEKAPSGLFEIPPGYKKETLSGF